MLYMYDYIFTIGYFDRSHKRDIALLKKLTSTCNKLIIGIYEDDSSIEKATTPTDLQSLEMRKKNIEQYADDMFVINSVDPTDAIKEYLSTRFSDYESIHVGYSSTNEKVVAPVSENAVPLFFIHNHKDTFDYVYKDKNLIVRRTDADCGWGQNLIAYPKNWCCMLADENCDLPGKDYISSIMPIKVYNLNYKDDRVGLMNYILEQVVDILNDHHIPYYLDCGTLLGCIRENALMKHDSDVDVTIHLSMWNKLNSIDFNKYGLKRTRTMEGSSGYLISVKTSYADLYCDIYANPAFPLVIEKTMNGNVYSVPTNSELYLTQLYGDWRVPSGKHADWPNLFYNKLVTSDYSKYWDLNYEITKKAK
jgi:hypothetical protein